MSIVRPNKRTFTKYEAKTPFGPRTYEMVHDAIRVCGEVPPHGRFDITFKAAELDPSYEKLELPGLSFMVGMWVTVAGLGAYAIETGLLRLDGLSRVCVNTLLVTFGGAALFYFGLRQSRIARFKTKLGTPAFDVFADGPIAYRYAKFVRELVRRIPK